MTQRDSLAGTCSQMAQRMVSIKGRVAMGTRQDETSEKLSKSCMGLFLAESKCSTAPSLCFPLLFSAVFAITGHSMYLLPWQVAAVTMYCPSNSSSHKSLLLWVSTGCSIPPGFLISTTMLMSFLIRLQTPREQQLCLLLPPLLLPWHLANTSHSLNISITKERLGESCGW